MIDHLSLPVTDLARSLAFYDAALEPLGYRRVIDVGDVPDYAAAGYGPAPDQPAFWIGAPTTDGPGVITMPPGQHIAFRAPSRAAVNAFHRAALAAGGSDNGAPALRPHYHPTYYAAFIIDPDGYHIEAVCHRPE